MGLQRIDKYGFRVDTGYIKYCPLFSWLEKKGSGFFALHMVSITLSLKYLDLRFDVEGVTYRESVVL